MKRRSPPLLFLTCLVLIVVCAIAAIDTGGGSTDRTPISTGQVCTLESAVLTVTTVTVISTGPAAMLAAITYEMNRIHTLTSTNSSDHYFDHYTNHYGAGLDNHGGGRAFPHAINAPFSLISIV